MTREKLSGSRRLVDHLWLGLSGLAALFIAALGSPRWLAAVGCFFLLAAALTLWAMARARAQRERRTLDEHLKAQARMAELLLPVWQAQLQMAGEHTAQATEAVALHLSNAVLLVGRTLPPHLAYEPCAALWRAEREAVLTELQETTLGLQFQDRIDQVLAHVRLSIGQCREQLEQSCQHFDATGRPMSVDVDSLLGRLEDSYAMDEERVIHRSHVAVTDLQELSPSTARTTQADATITYF
ncbi:hypothetical protein ACFJGW_09140 [Burkholderiaceae bacterium UC74_6]